MSKINTATKTSNSLIVFGIPLLLILSMVLIAKSKIFEVNPGTLSFAITIDLLFTIPILYFLLIKKKNIPKTTIIPFFVIGMLITSYIIPKEHQSLLNWAKNWIFPFVELGVFMYLFYKVRKTIKRYNANAKLKPDFLSALKETSHEILPKKIASLLTMELAVVYYGFIDWKKKRLAQHEFSYHKKSGTISLLIALIVIITIETYVLHVLLLKWSPIAAWIATILSMYSGIQLFGFLKSLMKRPIAIEEDKLHLRYGILSETIIDIANIDAIEITSKDMVFDTKTRKLSPFGELEAHNMVIRLKKENTLTGLYGIQKTFTTIAFFIDNKEEFKGELEKSIVLFQD
ncbi:hypothetical protein [Aquimarina algiphila]|uniref:Beta-carotene 15,15'-monooxygenase n=1 Tax=Aquimarina algiphila TaxID=2047982 RepID=A0A554VNZ7_9FLAO|nr:hypothetical protein [Aquimarina algiphila]TSE10117.1 hypothetical protein FOF46_06215 [Aquimarina algiphila]